MWEENQSEDRSSIGAKGETAESQSGYTMWPLAAEVLLVGAYVAFVAVAVVGFVDVPDTLRVLLALPFVFFLPGYAVLSTLFPGDETYTRAAKKPGWLMLHGNWLRWSDRVALSVGTSLSLLPPLGIALALTGSGYQPIAVVRSLGFVIVVGMILGGVRRMHLPEAERYHVPVDRWLRELSNATVQSDSLPDGVLNLLLIVLTVTAASTLVFAFVAPPAAESYSEFYLLTEGADGGFVSSGYPSELVVGEPTELYVGIDNNEGVQTTYTVVVELQRVSTTGTELTVLEREELAQFQRTLDDGERIREAHAVTPQLVGEDLRLIYYLYEGDAPTTASTETAYRSVYLWVSVTDA